jgi:hypothetical protein
MLYIRETVDWLDSAQDQSRGAWGVYYQDRQHATITGEVASALRDRLTPGLLSRARECLDRKIQGAGVEFAGIRSVVHLCWIVEGALNVGIRHDDPGVEALLQQLRESQTGEGWGWQLRVRGASAAQVYPTLMAVRVLRHLSELNGSAVETPSTTAAWLLRPFSRAPSGPQDIVRQAYSVQALCLLGQAAVLRDDDVRTMPQACAGLSKSQVFYKERVSLDGQNIAFEWSHSVLQQVLLATIAFDPRLIEEDPCPQLFARVFTDTIIDGDWFDTSKSAAAPYVAGDSMALMCRWRKRVPDIDGDSRVLRLLGAERLAREEHAVIDAARSAVASRDILPSEGEQDQPGHWGAIPQSRSGSGGTRTLAWIEFWIFWTFAMVVLAVWLKWPTISIDKKVPVVLFAAVGPSPVIPLLYQKGDRHYSVAVRVVGGLVAWATLGGMLFGVIDHL